MSCEWYNPITYGQCAGDAAKAAAGDAFSAIAQSFGRAADHAVSWLWGQMSAATAVHLGGAGFDLELGITAAIAGVVAACSPSRSSRASFAASPVVSPAP